MRSVQVLLSSYNGEKYIGQQIESILSQRNVKVSILIRDDGSEDGTCDVIRQYCSRFDNVRAICGANRGIVGSFFELLNTTDTTYDLYALADQDDVWLPEKLERASQMLGEDANSEIPLVYCSERTVVDYKLERTRNAIAYKNVRTCFENALVENMCSGCTCVINKAMLGLLRRYTPKCAVMHDFWIYLTGSCFGRVIYDPVSSILYRQHDNNELGEASSWEVNMLRRVKYRLSHRGRLRAQADEFLRVFGNEMKPEYKLLAECFLYSEKDSKLRRALLKEHKLFRQRREDDFWFRVLIRLNIL